jgi:PAS domain S-box-containing protein
MPPGVLSRGPQMLPISTLQKTTGGVIVFDEWGQIVLSNDYASNLFGYVSDELIGMSITKIIPPRILKKSEKGFSGSSEIGSQCQETIKLKGRKKQGGNLSLDICLSHFKGGKSRFTLAFVAESRNLQMSEATNDVELAPIIFLVLDKFGNVALINEYGCDIVGGTPEGMIGVDWFANFVPPDQENRLRKVYQKILKANLLENFESTIMTQSGGQLSIRWTTAVINDSRGEAVATLSTGIDTGKAIEHEINPDYVERIRKLNARLQISVKQQTHELTSTLAKVEQINRDLHHQMHMRRVIEERLMKIQRMYDTMVHNFPDGAIGVLNKDMKYVLLDGKDLGEIDLPVLGLTVPGSTWVQDPVQAEEILKNLKSAFNGEHVSFDVEARDRIYNLIAVPMPDSQSEINEILCVLRNVTDRRRMEDGLRKALEKERELGELKSRFVTMASHEFRTPLSTVLSSTFLLENYRGENFDNEKLIHTGRIKRAVNNLTMILNEFLSLEKLEEAQIPVAISRIDIQAFIRNVLFEMDLLKKDGQSINYHHSGERTSINLDNKLLWSVVTNLISNALKYSRENSQVEVKSEIKDDKLKLVVSDKGIGIPESEHKYIFERFYRAGNATNIEGTGLGLHIVQKYVQLMKGTITFKSKPEHGTDFIVELPNWANNE